ncbi:transposase [Moniliophthora roreri MCA 2997]|uniref:Transposase n=1 Tax=Moniliophthora roreri (strain MCA 2997) TaxID=1381753 RepID=V2WYF0_MONRO|nr:transposase [Moniliophthora roreri MCA 2997]
MTLPFPGSLSVIILDNACIHYRERILELANEYGVCIEFLSPYSPDYNPIEEAFSKIKHFIRWKNAIFLDIHADAGLLYDMYVVTTEVITPQNAQGYIRHVGYVF